VKVSEFTDCTLSILEEMKSGVYTISEEHMRPPVVELLLKWMYLQKIDVPKGDLVVSIFL
jgi:hypothetical protein